jgi:CheY-like chemotaxis protein
LLPRQSEVAEAGTLIGETMSKKILCVDDSNLVLMMEKFILAKEKYHLLTAGSGPEALKLAREHAPDLILLDVVMPVMDGFETCRQLRAETTTSHIPVIMVTTRSEAANVEQGYMTGCNDYVVKPIDAVELLTKVRNCLGGEPA